MSYQGSLPRSSTYSPGPESGVLAKVVAVFPGIAVAVLAILAVWLAVAANDARDDAQAAAEHTQTAAPAAPMTHVHGTASGTVATPSFAGMAPENADAL